MLRSTVFSSAWSSVVTTFEKVASGGADGEKLPLLKELREHHSSVCNLVCIIDDATGFMKEASVLKPDPVGKPTMVSFSDSASSLSSVERISKLQGKERNKKSHNPDRTARRNRRLTESDASDVSVLPVEYSTNSDMHEQRLGSAELAIEEPPKLSKSVFSAAENVVIWNAYIRNGCQVLTPEACTAISHTINRTSLASIQSQMKRLAAVDQEVTLEEAKKCLFSKRNDRRIWRTHEANQQRTPKDRLNATELCAAMTKYIPQSALRIQYRLQLLLAEHDAVNRADEWTKKAMEVVSRRRKRKYSGASLTYTAEEDQILLDAYLSSSQPAERSAILVCVAKGLNRTAASVRGRIRRLLPDQPTQFHSAQIVAKPSEVVKTPTADGSSRSASDSSDGSSSNSEVKNVGVPYTAADDDVIWNAYMSSFQQATRLQALKQAAAQLKRSLGGIISRVKHLQNRPMVQPSLSNVCSSAHPSVDTPKASVDTTTTPTTNLTNSTTRMAKVKSRANCEYTEDEDMAIWEAYFSSEGLEGKEALRKVAARFGRSFGAVRTHLQVLLDQQTREPDGNDGGSGASSDADSLVDGNSANKNAADNDEPALDEEYTDSLMGTSGNTHDSPHFASSLHTALELAFAATLTDNHHSNNNGKIGSFRHVATRPAPLALQSAVLQAPIIPPLPALPHSPRTTVHDANQALEDPSTSGEPSPCVTKFLSKLKRTDMTVLFPLAVHDQLLCIVLGCLQYIHQHCASYVSSQSLRKLFVRVKEELVSTYPRLQDVSNRKFYFVRNLLVKAECMLVERNQFMHTTFRLHTLVYNISDMRRRHDRYLCSLMTEEHARLQYVLCWPIDKAGKKNKSLQMEPVLSNVEATLQRLVADSEFSFLREG